MEPSTLITLADYEDAARTRMAPDAWGYYMGGAGDERSIGESRQAWDRLWLRPRVLVDVRSRDLTTTVLGSRLAHPIVVAPTAAHDLAHPEGEAATARGAAALGGLFTLSTISSVPMEDVRAVGGPQWFQLYTPADRAACRTLVERAVLAGYGALVVTVDLPLPGNRDRDRRSGFVLHMGVHLPPTQPTDQHGIVELPTLSWDDLAWIRSICPIPLVAKGILRADDARRAVDLGCDGIWVSNHGGRQLDTSIPPAEALPDVVGAVGESAAVIVDGGVRRGIDVLKGLALGADLVAVGRPVLWGLAVGGEAGVRGVLETIRDELSLAMALAGCRGIAEIGSDLVQRQPAPRS
jgi:4-hydroxymandelate oxidase